MSRGRGVALIAAACALVAPAVAGADTRYAEPNGDGPPASCPQNDPCSLQVAVENAAVVDGDAVVLLGDAYEVQTNTLDVSDAITLVGATIGDPPRIPTTVAPGISVNDAGAVLRDLRVESSSAAGAAILFSAGGTAERIFAWATEQGIWACQLAGAVVLRDSVCWASPAGGRAIEWNGGGAVNVTALLRNVTAVATGSASFGIRLGAFNGADLTLAGRNVIFGGTTDTSAEAGITASTSATISLTSSNFDTVTEGAGLVTTTAAGSGTNQVEPPAFANAALGDFHQLSGSPTIDRGSIDAALGSVDIDGMPRIENVIPDIGADEFVASDPVEPVDTVAPETTISEAPRKKVKTKKRKVKAEFAFASEDPTASFQCSSDQRAFAPCSSPVTTKVGTGRHSFAVFATDTAGNADATPAAATWRVKRKRIR